MTRMGDQLCMFRISPGKISEFNYDKLFHACMHVVQFEHKIFFIWIEQQSIAYDKNNLHCIMLIV